MEEKIEILLARIEKLLASPAIQREWLSPREAAIITGLSLKRIRKAIKSGELRASDLNGDSASRRTLKISRKEIDAWYERGLVQTAPSKGRRNELVGKFFKHS